MRGLRLLAAALPALSACAGAPPPEPAAAAPIVAAPEPPPVASPAPRAAPSLSQPHLYGRWQIVSLNGRPPAAPVGQVSPEPTPHIAFGPFGYGGNVGCNSFGGYGLFEDGRYYASGATMTAMACRDLMAQEEAVVNLMTASPRFVRQPDETLTVSAGGAEMVLRRAALVPQPDIRNEVLAGTSWILSTVDRMWLSSQTFRPPELRFEADRWTLSSACGTSGGAWRQRGDRIEAETPSILTRACAGDAAALDDRIHALLAASPRFVTGPNGEILIGGGDHWTTGQRPRMPLADDAPLLAGSWSIVDLNGAKPAGEPRIAFGPTGFSGGTGCNSMQGHYLAHGRRFFAAPPIRTEIGCPGALRVQEESIAALLAAAPRIALAGEGEIALVAPGLSMRLRREGTAAPSSPAGRIWAGTPLRAELISLGASPFQTHYSDPVTHIRLSAQRWDIEAGCGRFGGIWRREETGAVGLFTDPERDPAGACAAPLINRLQALHRFFNGRARILVGESGELLIAGEETWLSGRVVPSGGRR